MRPNPGVERQFYQTVVDETVALDIKMLNEKIPETIPKLKQRVYVLKWADSEGNEHPLPNNEALKTALTEMEGPKNK